MSGLVRLWPLVPPEERITVRFVLKRVGASDPMWLDRWCRLIRDEGTCQAAVRWTGTKLWHQCSQSALSSESFCPRHGGARRPKVHRSQLNLRERVKLAELERDAAYHFVLTMVCMLPGGSDVAPQDDGVSQVLSHSTCE